jgi:hypothetical protein
MKLGSILLIVIAIIAVQVAESRIGFFGSIVKSLAG